MRGSLLPLIVFLCITCSIKAQGTTDLADYFQTDSEALTDIEEELEQYRRHPLDLNKADYAALRNLPFLSDLQINALLEHRNISGTFSSIYEIQTISYFDDKTITYLLPYVTVQEINGPLKPSHILVARYKQLLQKKEGFKISDPEKQYAGSPGLYLIKYRFQQGNRFKAGFTAEKDAGEAFGRKGFDFYSGTLSFTGNGLIHQILAGDYSITFGQGLAVWNGYSLGKGSQVLNVARRNESLKPYSSTGESRFFRGSAIELKQRSWRLLSFYSYRKLDGKLKPDSSFIFYTDGLHRNVAEQAYRKQIHQQVAGNRISYNRETFSAGVSSVYYSIGNEAFRDERFLLSADYFARIRNFLFAAEVARSGRDHYAFVQTVSFIPDPSVLLSFLYRKYDPGYLSPFSSGFAESSTVNEQGLYSGLSILLYPAMRLNLYADLYHFHASSRIRIPSGGQDLFAELKLDLSKTTHLLFRFRSEVKDFQASDISTYGLEHEKLQRLSIEIRYKPSNSAELKNRMELNAFQKPGVLLMQDIHVRCSKKTAIDLRYTAFTSAEGSSFYSYEKELPGSSSFAVLNGTGIRFYTLIQYDWTRNVESSLHFAETWFKDRNTIGTGLDKTQGNNLSEISGQFIFRF